MYLDTSAIRALGRGLGDWSAGNASSTSMITLVELLNGIDGEEGEFQRRRASILALTRSATAVVWERPQAKILRAFDHLRIYGTEDGGILSLRALVKLLEQTPDLDAFVRARGEADLDAAFDYFARYDKEFGIGLVQEARAGFIRIREAFRAQPTSQRTILTQLHSFWGCESR